MIGQETIIGLVFGVLHKGRSLGHLSGVYNVAAKWVM